MALGVEPMPPGTRRGAEVRRKDHLLFLAQTSERRSSSHISPMGVPWKRKVKRGSRQHRFPILLVARRNGLFSILRTPNDT
jgi:hypothetical protein